MKKCNMKLKLFMKNMATVNIYHPQADYSGESRDFSKEEFGFQRGGVALLLWVFEGWFHSKIHYFYPILSKFSDERGVGGSDPRNPPSDPPMD
jgi:hypothetical protein